MIKHFAANALGRDFVVGDIHGCFGKLETDLGCLMFDPERDRLFSVGDLVDRGPDSELALEWLAKPWFHAVRGNHEQMAIDAAAGGIDRNIYIYNGGAWFLGLAKPEQTAFADAFSALPIAIDIETPSGLVGILHADCAISPWHDLLAQLEGERGDLFAQCCMWSRERITAGDTSTVAGVARVIVGHTPLKQVKQLGNVEYIDTGAVFGGKLTIVQIN